jgi:hypothetical protein
MEAPVFLILIELDGNRPIKSYVVELPSDFLFYDDKYPYYIIYSKLIKYESFCIVLRVSTLDQTNENQKVKLIEYANHKGYEFDVF